MALWNVSQMKEPPLFSQITRWSKSSCCENEEIPKLLEQQGSIDEKKQKQQKKILKWYPSKLRKDRQAFLHLFSNSIALSRLLAYYISRFVEMKMASWLRSKRIKAMEWMKKDPLEVPGKWFSNSYFWTWAHCWDDCRVSNGSFCQDKLAPKLGKTDRASAKT